MKNLKLYMNKILFIIYISVIFAGMLKTYLFDCVETVSLPVNKLNIVIDAGHGGFDPGKVEGNINEKEINLKIAHKLQLYLEQGGSYVITTRTDDSALSSKKRNDLKERIKIVNTNSADLMISIHQNSFPGIKVKGAQVFYYKTSEKSKLLAEAIQQRIKEIDKNNTRIAKSNSNYYVLKKSEIPAVIVECGFLSNPEENAKLCTEEYQEKIAWSIYLGINDYLKLYT